MRHSKEFQDSLDIYVFTTKQVIEDKEPIVFVSHDQDGDWQFMNKGNHTEKDARIISLGEMIQHDSTILDIADLPLGWQAERKSIDSKWSITPS